MERLSWPCLYTHACGSPEVSDRTGRERCLSDEAEFAMIAFCPEDPREVQRRVTEGAGDIARLPTPQGSLDQVETVPRECQAPWGSKVALQCLFPMGASLARAALSAGTGGAES
jgi:hypothetical protein